MGKVDPDDPRPPYQQVADRLRSAIDDGEVMPGQPLPKQPELATDYGVSVGTVKHALRVLRDEGLIVSRRGEGARVHSQRAVHAAGADTTPVADQDIRDMLADVLVRLDEIVRRLDSIERRR
jgi:DNA-binding GntR family transcriptional regulator